jgi:D-3-phosphoglycerate dehydrogenase / 2-oxoglutarate reductase
VNENKPGFIGKLDTLLGDAQVNLANFNLGRSEPGQESIALVAVDGPIGAKVLADIRKIPHVRHAKSLEFWAAATCISAVAVPPLAWAGGG